MAIPALRPAVFLDRDGVLIDDCGYPHRIEDLAILPGVEPALAALRDAGYLLILVTNQSGIARGLFAEAAMHRFHEELQARLEAFGARLDDIRFCPHHPHGSVPELSVACACRKPAPGMILSAISALNIDPARSILIGDRESDVAAGRSAGLARTFLIARSGTQSLADGVFPDLAGCVAALLEPGEQVRQA